MWKKIFEPVDMTAGDPVRQIVKYMIPMLIAFLFEPALLVTPDLSDHLVSEEIHEVFVYNIVEDS